MRNSQTGKMIIGFSALLLWLLLLAPGLSAQEPEPTRVRPTVDPLGATAGDSTASVDDGRGSSDNCAAVYGAALHWGVGGQGGVGLRLGGGGWQVEQATSDDGRYHFGGLGVGLGILQVEPGFPGLHPMIDQAAVRLSCDFATQAVIGLYSGAERPTPPGRISMQTSTQTIAPGDGVEFILTVTNTLPNPISQVVVTDLFPEGLTIKSVNASAGTVELVDGKMLAVMIGDIPEGGTATISVFTRLTEQAGEGAQLVNTATLFYAESAADQASTTIEVSSPVASAQTATDAAAAATAPGTGNVQASAQDEAAPAGADDPDVLPVTGFGGTLSFSLVILALIGLLAKGAYSIKKRSD